MNNKNNRLELVSRKCSKASNPNVNEPIAHFRDLDAYILLGDSGMGKTTLFKQEALETGGEYITARNFITCENREKNDKSPLFIDALDEMYSGNSNRQEQIDKLRKLLSKADYKVRLSCRTNAWTENVLNDFKDAPSNKELTVLFLNPLSKEDIQTILYSGTINNPNEFIEQAGIHKLDKLLYNPQILQLVIKATTNNTKWPTSRNEIYQMACEKLLIENNSRHNEKLISSTNELFTSAGYLCAIQLLSGISGFNINSINFDDSAQYYNLKDLDIPTRQRDMMNKISLKEALQSNIFKSDNNNNDKVKLVPIHSSIAEYLGAKYLSDFMNKEQDSLLLERILTLIPDENGILAVESLRSICAWMATLNLNTRKIFIERDPLGIIQYGDVTTFNSDEIKLTLETLRDRTKYTEYPFLNSYSFGKLFTQGTLEIFCEFLSKFKYLPNYSDQQFLSILIYAVAHGDKVHKNKACTIQETLKPIIFDYNYTPFIRSYAIEAVIKNFNKPSDEIKWLQDMLSQINNGKIEDSDDELITTILERLYQIKAIKVKEIWDYFRIPKRSNIIGGRYITFFCNIIKNVTIKELPELFENLIKKQDILTNNEISIQFSQLLSNLLMKGLNHYGNKISKIDKITSWLELLKTIYDGNYGDDYLIAVKNWFIDNQPAYTNMIKHIVSLSFKGEKQWYNLYIKHVYSLDNIRQLHVPYPKEIANWLIEQSLLAYKTNKEDAQNIFKLGLIASKQTNQLNPDRLNEIKSTISKYKGLQSTLDNFINPKLDEALTKHMLWEAEHETNIKNKTLERTTNYRKQITAINDGLALAPLVELADVYIGILSQGKTPDERLMHWLNDDIDLVNASYNGFEAILQQQNLPTAQEIIKQASQNRRYNIRRICAIGINQIYRTKIESVLKFHNNLLAALVAFHMTNEFNMELNKTRTNPWTIDQSTDEDSNSWVVDLINKNSKFRQLTIQIFIDYMSGMIKHNHLYVTSELWLHSRLGKEYSLIRDDALPLLLNTFPLRASKKNIEHSLGFLLSDALKNLKPEKLQRIIVAKLKKSSMDAIQKTYWLSCGLIINHTKYMDILRVHVTKRETYRHDMVNFLYAYVNDVKPEAAELNEQVAGFLIECAALESSPNWMKPTDSGELTRDRMNGELVYKLITRLEHSNSNNMHELERLSELASLSAWHPTLERALQNKKIIQSKISFKQPTIPEIIKVFNQDKSIGSARELWVVTYSALKKLAENISKGNTNDYKQYWNYYKNPSTKTTGKTLDESHSNLTPTPKDENDCRNLLLSDLKLYLKSPSILAEPEVQHRDATRSDITVHCNTYNIPIECKRDNSKELWTAIREQLIKKYTENPGTGGYGIYVVFWFGIKKLTHMDTGVTIGSPEQLEETLTSRLNEQEKLRIKVLVIDCSRPPAKPTKIEKMCGV